jgi:polysaccharide chain length determinant protein (PEP-CTERM system associated)
MEHEQSQQIKKYIDLVLRRQKIIISFVLVAAFAGLGVYVKLPKVYESTALLIYQQAKVNSGNKGSIRPGDVATETQEMVATLTQQVTSRSSLEAIIKQFDLYPRERQKLPMEDVVDLMRAKSITISPDKGDVFKVSFRGDTPKKVKEVANALAARFIEENLRYREEKATETSAYVGDELELAKSTLDKKEAVMRDYKLKNYNEMPQQFVANSNRLTALQTQLQANRTSAQELERTKILIQEQVTLRKEALSQIGLQASLGAESGRRAGEQTRVVNPAMAELAQARQQLADLKLRYTDNHPEVKRFSKKVEALEESQSALVKELGGTSSGGKGQEAGNPAGGAMQLHDSQLDELVVQFKKADLALDSLNQENEGLKKQIGQYEQWLSMTPVREAEWTALTRDYEQLNAHYQQLVGRNLEAGAAESLERQQKGSQFKIVDSAYLPEKPIRPDFKKIMLIALAAGLGLGGGLVFLLDLRDASFRDVADVEAYLGVPVICAISLIHTEQDTRTTRRKSIAWWSLVTLSVVGLLGALAYLYKSGRIII